MDDYTLHPIEKAKEIAEQLNGDNEGEWLYVVVPIAKQYAAILVYDEDGNLLGRL